MQRLSLVLVLLLAALVGGETAAAQGSKGSLEVSGRVSAGGQQLKLKRKRFYLFRGGLDANRALIDRIKAATPTTRDCFYCRQKASAEYVAWLKAGDCESPYCREITTDDVAKVPEFIAAYKKGLVQYKNKQDIARKWVTNNLPAALRDGFYTEEKTLLNSILGGVKPVQSSMTDSVSVVSIFIDIPLNIDKAAAKQTEPFVVSNLLPIEIGDKSYVWACEVEIGSAKKIKAPSLPIVDSSKLVKKCEVVVRNLPKCTNGSCGQ
ncbi:MAG TPA: hypothetical protein VGO43_04260 [Pyrinomonadaceae bacterium]|jgi:hypothetical protein|nr:hypothetical protein [Pyrinomonadaceae bacterium]